MAYIPKLLSATLFCLFLNWGPSVVLAQDRPFTEGHVWNFTFVRVKPGMLDAYMRELISVYKPAMEEAKKRGLILSYKFLVGQSINKDDANFIVLEEYKDFAAYDGLSSKMRAIFESAVGNETKQIQLLTARENLREIIGGKDMRELIPN